MVHPNLEISREKGLSEPRFHPKLRDEGGSHPSPKYLDPSLL